MPIPQMNWPRSALGVARPSKYRSYNGKDVQHDEGQSADGITYQFLLHHRYAGIAAFKRRERGMQHASDLDTYGHGDLSG